MTKPISNDWTVTDTQLLDGDEEFADEAAKFTSWGWDDESFYRQVQTVADRIFRIHLHRNVNGLMHFSFECGVEREITGVTVAIDIKPPGHISMYLMQFVDIKHISDDPDAIGWNQALKIKNALMRAYGNARSTAVATALVIEDVELEFTE